MLGLYILVISLLGCAIVGSLVMTRGLRDRTTIVYGLLTAALAAVCIMNSLAVMSHHDQLFYVRGVMGSTTIAMYLIYVLIMEIRPRRAKIHYLRTKLFYATLAMLVVDFTNLLFVGVIPGEPPKPIPNFGILFFFGLYIWTLVLGIKQLRKDMSQTLSAHERHRYAALITGIVPIIFLAPLTSFILPNYFDIDQFVILTPLYAFIFVMFVGYAIVRHGLFDIKRAVVRTVTYALSLLSLAGLYYLIAYTISVAFFGGHASQMVSLSPVNILLAITLSFIFQPLKRFFDRLTNRIFYRDAYDPQVFYEHFSELLASSTNLRGLLTAASTELARTLKAEQGFLYIHYHNTINHHMSGGTINHQRIPSHDINVINQYFETSIKKVHSNVVLTDSLSESNPLRAVLRRSNVAIVMPLVKEKSVVGFVFLGNHLSGSYTQQDIDVLSTISNSLVIAIQNMLSLHEVREINATLQQRIDTATKELRDSNAKLRHLDQVKDEFMSMASHQLRTPLTSVKGYVSMVLEGDAGDISTQQRHLLTEAFKSSERMVHLIADFLSVSRLQTGKFTIERQESNLDDIVQQEVSALKLVAKSHDLKLEYIPPQKALPPLMLDEAKIRQVVMNLIDNAIYYSREKTTIVITLERDTNRVSFMVADTGIGVPKNEQQHLFTKFFRARNARRRRPDGTGVGLFLAKKVVIAHGGSMIFHSVEDKGSTFGFRLPLV